MPEDGGEPLDAQALHDGLLQLAAALEERFGDREPSDAEVREFLMERLLAEGKTPAEAGAIVDEL